MSRRALAKQETRRRILEATAELHMQKGILGTTYQDIANAADVSLATVYNHFPTLDELVEGCGGLLMERYQPPVKEDLPEILGDASEPQTRLERVTRALYEFYDRAPGLLEVDNRERELPSVKEVWDYHLATVASFASAALSGVAISPQRLRLVTSLLDYAVFRAMRDRGAELEEAIEATVEMAMTLIERELP